MRMHEIQIYISEYTLAHTYLHTSHHHMTCSKEGIQPRITHRYDVCISTHSPIHTTFYCHVHHLLAGRIRRGSSKEGIQARIMRRKRLPHALANFRIHVLHFPRLVCACVCACVCVFVCLCVEKKEKKQKHKPHKRVFGIFDNAECFRKGSR